MTSSGPPRPRTDPQSGSHSDPSSEGPVGLGFDPPVGYLDAASAEPLHPAARAVLGDLLGPAGGADARDLAAWVDPARRYGSARRARILLDAARERVASAAGCRPDEVSFCSSASHARHLAVLGTALGRRRVGDTAVASAVEHSDVLAAVAGAGQPEIVEVDAVGRIDLDRWRAAVAAPGVALAALQAANHEVGTVQPVEDAAAACRAAGVPLVVDATHVMGRAAAVPSGWSVLAASANTWGGPAGLGVLAVRQGVRWRSPSPLDDRDPRVPGLPAVALAAAAAAALDALAPVGAAEDARLWGLVDDLRRELPERVPDLVVLGDPEDRLPHLLTVSCLYVDGETLLDALDARGFAVSSGSSCTSSALEPSHVLVAMGALTQGNLRISLPRGVREGDVRRLAAVLPDVVAEVRSTLGADHL